MGGEVGIRFCHICYHSLRVRQLNSLQNRGHLRTSGKATKITHVVLGYIQLGQSIQFRAVIEVAHRILRVHLTNEKLLNQVELFLTLLLVGLTGSQHVDQILGI